MIKFFSVLVLCILSLVSRAQNTAIYGKFTDQMNDCKISAIEARNQIKALANKQLGDGKNLQYLNSYYYLPWTYVYENNIRNAIKTWEEGIAECHKFKNTESDSISFKLHSDLATLFLEKQDLEDHFQSAYAIYKSNKSLEKEMPNNVISLLSNYAYFFQVNNDFEQSIFYLKEAARIGEDNLKNKELLSYVYRNLGRAYSELGKTSESIELFQKAIAISKLGLNKSKSLNDLGNTFLNENRLPEAVYYFKASNSALKNAGYFTSSYGQTVFFRNELGLAKILMANSQFNDAQLKIINIENNAPSLIEKIDALILSLNLPYAAIDTIYKKATEISQTDLANFTSLSPTLSNEILLAYARKTKTIKDYQNAINWMAQTRQNNLGSNAKSRISNQVHQLSTEILEVLNEENAFEIMELSKSAELLEVNRKIKINKPFVLELNKIDQKINALKIKIFESGLDSSNTKKLHQLYIEQGFVSQKIKKEQPNYYQLKYFWEPVKSNSIQNKLHKDELLIEYFMDDKTIYIFTIDKDAKKIISIPKPPHFEDVLNKLLAELKTKPGLGKFNGKSEAKFLYKYLITPFENKLKNKKKLIFIRDGILNIVPFEVLLNDRNEYLLEQFSISYEYSGSIWMHHKGLNKSD